MYVSRKLLLSLLALISFSAAMGLSTKIRKSNEALSPSQNMEALLAIEAETLLSNPRYDQQFIRTGPPSLAYNCHGWTFTAGKRSIPDDEVHKRLRFGGYRKVSTSLAGDIVLYYDDQNSLCHSGIVKATGQDGFVLVESKWGGSGRFLHVLELPQVQTRHEYYRRGKMMTRVPTK